MRVVLENWDGARKFSNLLSADDTLLISNNKNEESDIRNRLTTVSRD